jgi:hypothetical protein
MAIFDFLKKTEQEQGEEDFIDNVEPSPEEKPIYSVEFGTKLPIDIIYGFLRKDYESKAYQDALTNPDRSYKEINLAAMRSTLEQRLRQVLRKYDDMLHQVNLHIRLRSAAGLIDLVEQLESVKGVYERHVEELKTMRGDLDDDRPYMTGIFKSYEIGFTRGLASLSAFLVKDETL